MRVARYYCRKGRETFSLLPDFLAARLSGTLDQIEAAVVAAESVGMNAAARSLRVEEVELPGAERWLGRRVQGVHAAVLALVTALPGVLGAVAEVRALRAVLGTERALVALRAIGSEHLHVLRRPLGFAPPPSRRPHSERAFQHETGPDRPSP